VTEDTQRAIADDLGVSRSLVTQVANDPDVKDVTRNEVNTDEKREQVREFVEDTPDRQTVSPVLLGSTDRYSARGEFARESRRSPVVRR